MIKAGAVVVGALLAFVLAAAVPPTPASSAQQANSSMVFYSGFGRAGINHGEDYAAYSFVHSRDAEEPSWSGREECSTERSDDFPSGPDTLVGWSIGRNAPIFFLAEAPDRHDEIDTIWLLDPGYYDKMRENGCDFDLPRTPSAYLDEWLAGDPNHTLVILSGAYTELDNRQGLTQVYLDDINGKSLRNQVELCRIDSNIEAYNHDNRLVQNFIPFTVGPATCPTDTTKIPLVSYRGASGREGAVVRLYASVFNRLPDPSGFNFWVNDGRTTWQMADFFVTSDEFSATYGDLTDDEFLVALYVNVLGRGPDAAGLAFWQERLGSDLTRADVVVYFSDSTEFRLLTQTS